MYPQLALDHHAPAQAVPCLVQDVIRQLDCVATAFEAAKLADHDAPHVDLASLPAGAPFLPTLNGCAYS